MPKRRDVIRIGGTVVATGFIGGLSGCLDSGGSTTSDDIGSSDGDDGRENTNDESDNEYAREQYESALNLLEQNEESLDEFAESDPRPETFNENRIHRRADSADEHLEDAVAYASGEDLARIENAQSIAAYQREAATYNALAVDLGQCLDTIGAYIDSERWDDAVDHVSDCQDIVDDLQSQWSAVERTHGEIDPVYFDSAGQLEYDDVAEDLNIEGTELDVLDVYLDGIAQFLEGITHFMNALDRIDSGKSDESKEMLYRAERKFYTSENTFARVEDDPDTPNRIRSDVVTDHCYAGSFGEASGHFAEAIEAEQRNDTQTANYHWEKGDQALDRCE